MRERLRPPSPEGARAGPPAYRVGMPPDVVAEVAAWIREAGAVTVLTGAGMSTESGIPDFRGPDGLWTRDPGARRLFEIDAYRADPEIRRQAWRRRSEHPAWTARPHRGHQALVDLERSGRLRALITQNIDGLHQVAGNTPERVLELHGSIHRVECLGCGWTGPTARMLERVAGGEEDPHCVQCGDLVKTATVSFGQRLDRSLLAAAVAASAEAELFVAVGTTLSVRPAASLVDVARRAGARIVIVNAGATAYDAVADARLEARIGEVLPLLVGQLAAA
jgi:NAD-dependent deacetylase